MDLRRFTLSVAITASLAPRATNAQSIAHSRESHAISGTLVFTPPKPRHGDFVRVTYDPADALAHDTAVELRGIRRSNRDLLSGNPRTTVTRIAVLKRGRDGQLNGTFRFPGDADMLRLAVGSLDSTRADGNLGAHWRLLAHNRHAIPLQESFAIAIWDLLQRNAWDEALATAHLFTDHYPDAPAAWFHRVAAEIGVRGYSDFNRDLPRYQQRLASLDERFGRVTPSPDDAALMYWLALQLRDTSRSRTWRTRLLADFPRHPLAVQEAASDIAAKKQDPSATLAELEALSPSEPVPLQLSVIALAVARRAGDTLAFRRWLARAVREGGHTPLTAAQALAETAPYEREGLRAMDQLERGLPERPHELTEVDGTLQSEEPKRASRRREVLLVRGRVLLRLRDSVAALDAYVKAADLEWSPPVFRTVRTLALALRDSARARDYALLSFADPLVDKANRDSLLQLLSPADTSILGQITADAFTAMRKRLPPLGSDTVDLKGFTLSREGVVTSASELSAQRNTVLLALWGPGCPAARADLPSLAAMQQRLPLVGSMVVVATSEEPSADLAAYLARQASVPLLFHDPANNIRRRLSAYGLPWYFVIDAGGRVLYRGSSLPIAAAFASAYAAPVQ